MCFSKYMIQQTINPKGKHCVSKHIVEKVILITCGQIEQTQKIAMTQQINRWDKLTVMSSSGQNARYWLSFHLKIQLFWFEHVRVLCFSWSSLDDTVITLRKHIGCAISSLPNFRSDTFILQGLAPFSNRAHFAFLK